LRYSGSSGHLGWREAVAANALAGEKALEEGEGEALGLDSLERERAPDQFAAEFEQRRPLGVGQPRDNPVKINVVLLMVLLL
jgi:hypothetical protein